MGEFGLKKWRPVSLFGPLGVSLLLLACAEAVDQPAGTSDVPLWSVSSNPRVTIGQLEGDPAFLFQRISSATLIPDGRIAVADNGAANIRVFRQDGSFEREIGRRGEGPGEFSYLSSVSLLPPDTLVVYDSRLYRLTRFLASGSLVSTLQIQAEDGFPELYLGRYSSGQMALSWIKQGPRDANAVSPDVMQFGRFGENGRLVSLTGTETGMVRFGSPVPFSPHLHAVLVGDSLFVTNGLLPEIQVRDADGRIVRTVQVPVDPVDEPAAWNILETELRARESEMWLPRLGAVPRDLGIPHLALMTRDDKGRLWVKKYAPLTDSHWLATWDRGRGGEWLVMDPGGQLLAKVQLPDDLLLLDVRGDQLVGKTSDDLGVERIQLYDIIRMER